MFTFNLTLPFIFMLMGGDCKNPALFNCIPTCSLLLILFVALLSLLFYFGVIMWLTMVACLSKLLDLGVINPATWLGLVILIY
jgi:type IV secretory pathway TrbD component